MASRKSFELFMRNEAEITQAICQKKTLSVEVINKIKKATKGYCLIQNCYESYMTFCLVYEEVQTKLIGKIECNALVNQVLLNVLVLVQGLHFIENGERFRPKDDRVTGNSNHGLNHSFGFTGFGVNDFQSADKRVTSYLKWFENNRLKKRANIIFLTVDTMSRLMNDHYNSLRKKF